MSVDTFSTQPKSAEELIPILRRECELRRANIRMARLGSICLILGIIGVSLVAWILKGTPPLESLKDYSSFFLIALGGVALTATHRRALLDVQGSDPRLIGFLIEALTYREAELVRHVEDKLVEPLLRTESIPAAQRRLLAERLAVSKNVGFVRSALAALGNHGGAECLEGLEDLARRKDDAGTDFRLARLKPLALQASADVRLRVAKGRIDRERSEAQERFERAGGANAKEEDFESHLADTQG